MKRITGGVIGIAVLSVLVLAWQWLPVGEPGLLDARPAPCSPAADEDPFAVRRTATTVSSQPVAEGVVAAGLSGDAMRDGGVRSGHGEAMTVDDSEWAAMERNRYPPEHFFESARRGQADTRLMYRNVTINEHDRYVPPAVREQIERRLEPVGRSIQMLADIEWKYQESELRRLVATGVIQPEPVGPSPKQIELFLQVCESQLQQLRERQRAGHDVAGEINRLETEMRDVHVHAAKLHVSKPHTVWLADEKGRFYDLDARRLPGQAQLQQVTACLRMEFYGCIVSCFDTAGVLTERGRTVLMGCAAGRRPNGR